MSKSHVLTKSRSLFVFGTILVILSLALTACSANPIPETGGTPGVVSTDDFGGTDLTPGAVSTMPAGSSTEVSPTVEATSSVGGTSTEVSPTMGATSAVGEAAEINVVDDPQLGQILVGNDNRTLYAFTDDTENTSNCDESCQVNWPPFVTQLGDSTQGDPLVGTGVDETLLGTASLADGRTIVTYNGHPLYYFSGDTAEGDVNGQGLNSKWFVVSPDGEFVGQGM